MKATTTQASNSKAMLFLMTPVMILWGALICLVDDAWILQILGVLLLSFFMTQQFILLHECGHLNFFKGRRINVIVGAVFGFLAGLPFYNWMMMHHLHHKWTGWRDRDPTTEKTVDPSASSVVNVIANISWVIFFPIFYVVYHVSNYWDLKKMKRFLRPREFKLALISTLIYFAGYLLMFFWLSIYWKMILTISFFLSCIWRELIILTQHTHVDIPIAGKSEVKPISYHDQIPYTRSFYMSQWFTKYFLFNFNLHEAHHAYPGLPAYYLDEINLNLEKSPSYKDWLMKAKSLSGVDFVFKTNKDTTLKF